VDYLERSNFAAVAESSHGRTTMVNTRCGSQVLLFGDDLAAELACLGCRGVEDISSGSVRGHNGKA
jgi:hypothetical protein